MTYSEKAALMTDEILEMLRNKPVNSTLVERWKLIDEAADLYGTLPQPLKLGFGLQYVIEHASLPLKEYDILLGRFDDHVPTDKEENFIHEFHKKNRPQFMVEGGHITLDWEKIIAAGISGYIKQAEDELERRTQAGENGQTLLFYMGASMIMKAYRRYIVRYASAARTAGMKEIAGVCDNIADFPPRTFYEAMQLVTFITTVYYVYAGGMGPTLTLGRLDDLLLPLYETELRQGTLDYSKAAAIIDDFNAKTNLILGRGEHQMSGGAQTDTGWWRNNVYDAPTYVVIGGYSNKHGHRVNPLTALFAERINPRYENPVYVYRRTKGQNEKVWRLLCDKVRKNASILIYNDETVIPAFISAGIDKKDAIDYTMHGCNWPDIPAKYCVTDFAGGSLARMVIEELIDSEGKLKRQFTCMDELFNAIADTFRASIKQRFENYRSRFRRGAPYMPPERISCTDCFTEGVLENGNTIDNGAVKYPVLYTLLRHIGTAADILSAIEKNVFIDKKFTLAELTEAMRADFTGYEKILKKCRTAPKFGIDNDTADMNAVRLMKLFQDIIDEESINTDGIKDVISFNVTITDMGHVGEGARLPASPDGRRKSAPLSENLSPTAGYAESVTALLNSVSKLPFDRICSGALNLRLSKKLFDGDTGLDRFIILSDTYFERGGMQLQVSVADTAELRDAQLHPENYKDLMVRITGYSAVFVDMCPSAQNEIIRRDEL
ncbi:MAG: pyruvate formate lyase family protein [Eubacteriales bacterium]